MRQRTGQVTITFTALAFQEIRFSPTANLPVDQRYEILQYGKRQGLWLLGEVNTTGDLSDQKDVLGAAIPCLWCTVSWGLCRDDVLVE